jgi:hypothetical protein
VWHSFGYIPKESPGVGLLDHTAELCLDFLRSFQIFFQSGCTSLHSHQQCMSDPSSPHPCQNLLLVVFLMIAILTGVRWNLSEVLICIFFMARDDEHFFMCFWPFEFLLLRKFCLVQLPISLLVH